MKVHTIPVDMQLSQKQKISILSIIIATIFGGGIWYFFFSSEAEELIEIPETKPVISENNDDIRIRHLTLIEKALKESLSRKVLLPLPENALQVNFEELPIVYQGKAGRDFFDTLGLNDLVDPEKGTRYDYALSADRQNYQLVAYLDDAQRSNALLEKTVFFSIWNTSDLFFRDFAGNIISREKVESATIDIATSENRRKMGLEPLKSCKEIYAFKSTLTKARSGVYTIDINGRATKVFCDMQTDWGGWTLFYANNGYQDSPIQKSYVEMRDSMETEPLLDLSKYDDQYLTGLLDFKHFIKNNSTELLIRNRTGDVKKWVKFSFSASRTLEWALGPLVLWKTEYGCVSLPRRDTWSIFDQSGKFLHENLRQIMNHWGTSWGVSHEKYACNSFIKDINPFMAFYNSLINSYEWRARSNDSVWWWWWKNGEYRYFIR